MDKRFLENCLAEGMSLERIGELTGKHPSTVGYWLKKHGLKANGADRYGPKGTVDPDRLRELIEAGASIRKAAEVLGVSATAVRHWIKRLGLETERMRRRKQATRAHELGLRRTYMRCRIHGHTVFFARPDGNFRCAKCNSAAVAKRRRTVKRRLIAEAGGACILCGYDRYAGALHFHHLDPTTKEFPLSRRGVTRAFAEVQEEAQKCVLLCANCHAEVEGGFAQLAGGGRYSEARAVAS